MYENIVVPLDGSKFAEQALPHAAQIAVPGSSRIHLLSVAPLLENQALSVVDLYPVYMYRDYVVDQREEMERVQRELEVYLGQAVQRLQEVGHKAECAIRYGQPADEIITFAEDNGCDLIAMSTHGRSGIGRWVYGSVADKVLRGSKVPVLLVRVREPQD